MNQKYSVKQIDVVASGKVRVTFRNGDLIVRRRHRKFAVGKAGKGAALLARFVAKHRLGHVNRVYRFLTALPEDYRGTLPLPLNGDCR
jgi:hypothetical protein